VNVKKWMLTTVPVLLIGASLSASNNGKLTDVPAANPKVAGVTSANVLSPELQEVAVAQGSIKMEGGTALTGYYGYFNDVLAASGTPRMLSAPGVVPTPSPAPKVEATKSEPDKNTYLILRNQDGPDAHYDYGTHFLFQGHEGVVSGQSYLTRVNLDADGAHRVTLLATTDVNGHAIPTIDGSTWYPFSNHLLLTSENGASGGVFQATANYPSTVEDLSGIFGRGGYEGIQADNRGNIIIVEDSGGSSGTLYPHAKRPNSFVYRFIPYNPLDLRLGGKLQVLQVMSKAHAGPIVFGTAGADADIKSQDTKDIHTYGLVFQTQWVTIHDTATQGSTPFDANAAAKAAGGTPFKRPENGQFRPGTNFSEFIFDETGDTNALTEVGSEFGGFGSVLRLRLTGANSGTLNLVYLSDVVHSAFDNCAFISADQIVFVEDAGDTLHTQRNALDSAYIIDLNAPYSIGAKPIRILAEGRDPSATIDSALLDFSGFQNEGDNEITGFHVSDGDPSVHGLLGDQIPRPFDGQWRMFYTQQHGDNITWEILSSDQDGNGHGNGQGDDND
jgi:uncharacterized protein DUF839